ncbi:mitochondrial import receptor subunit TOM20-like protein, partial [Tanacetum coccineum]
MNYIKNRLKWLQSSVIMAPELHSELLRQSSVRHSIPLEDAAAGPSTSFNARGLKPQRSSDLKYEICGWVILAVGIVVWVGLAKA